MRVALGCVQEKVTDPRTSNVLMLRCDVGEDYTGRNLRAHPGHSRLSEVRFSKIGKPEQPQDGLRNPRKYSKPYPKRRWLDLRSLAYQYSSNLDGKRSSASNADLIPYIIG